MRRRDPDPIDDLYRELHARLGNRPSVEARIREAEAEEAWRLGYLLDG